MIRGMYMAHEPEILDISNSPDLLRLAEVVRASNTPRVLRRGNEDVAIVMPPVTAPKGRSRRSPIKRKTQADIDAFLSSAGSWKDVDVDTFKAYIRERRDASSRPPVTL